MLRLVTSLCEIIYGTSNFLTDCEVRMSLTIHLLNFISFTMDVEKRFK